MQIILGDKKAPKIDDAIEYILNADNKTFSKIMREFKSLKGDLDIRYQAEIDDLSKTQELAKIADLILAMRQLDKSQYTEEQQQRLEKIIKCRNSKDLQKYIKHAHNLSRSDARDIVAVLTGEKPFKELVKEREQQKPERRSIFSFFRRNKEKALPEPGVSPARKYGHLIEKIVSEDVSFKFPIENFDNENYARVQTILFDEREGKQHQLVIGKDVEADWKINPELREYVYKDMPLQLTPEEQAVWIYMKLCKTFSYDDKQIFDGKDFSLDRNFLEGVKPGDKLVCFDFSRIYAKFINQDLGDSLEAKVIGSKGHFLVELIGQDSVITAEATTAQGHSNEFYKMRMGLPISGIKPSYDPNQRYYNATIKLTPLVYEDVQTINSYMSMLDTIREREESEKNVEKVNDIQGKMEALVKTMKAHGIDGTEAMMGIMEFRSNRLFW